MHSVVAVVSAHDGELVVLGKASREFTEARGWSPAGDLFAYQRQVVPYRVEEARVLNPVTESDRVVVATDGRPYPFIIGLAWSPDGRRLAVLRWENYAGERLEIVEVPDGALIRRLALEDEARLVEWAP